jgi:hypothetical protein
MGHAITDEGNRMPDQPMTGDSTATPALVPAVGRGLRTPRAAAIAGIAFGVLYILSTYVITLRPPANVTPLEFAQWYRTTAATNLTIVSLYLFPLAGIAFLWFIAVIRNRIGEREDRFFATVFIGSGLLFVAMLWATGATVGSLVDATRADRTAVPDPVTFDLVRSLAHTFFYVYATRAAAIFIVVTSTIALGTGAFPRWLIVLGYVIAVVQFISVGELEITVLLFPAWVIVLSLFILVGEVRFRRTSDDDPEAAAGAAATYPDDPAS